MISPRWRKVVRDVWQHKARTGLVVLAISFGIAGAGAVLDTWTLMRRVTREGFDGTNPASATIRVDSINAALVQRVAAMPAIRNVQARRTVLGSVWGQGSWRTAMLFAMQDFTTATIGTLQPLSGAWPPRDGAVTIEKSSVEFAGVAIGDSVRMQVGDKSERVLSITGITRDAGLPPGWMDHLVYAFVTPATLAQLGAPSTMNDLQIVVRDAALDREAVRKIAFDVRALAQSAGHTVGDVDVPVPHRHEHAAQIDSLLYTQGAFGLLALFLSGLLVVNLMAAMLAGQVREIGVMKAIGARGPQIAQMYFVLALVLGLVSCALAIPAGALIGRAYADFTANLLNFDIAAFTIPWQAFAAQLAVGVLLPVVAAAVPVLRGSRISVNEALRDIGIDATHGDAPRGLILRVGGLTRPLLLSLRNAFRRRQRMALTLVTLATGGAVYLGALNLQASVRGAVDLLFAPQKFEISLRFAAPHRVDSIERAIRATSGVTGAEAWTGARARVDHGGGMLGNVFSVLAPPLGSPMLQIHATRGRWLETSDGNAIVVNRRLLEDEPALAVGKTVPLLIGGRSAEWTVVGVVESGPSPQAYAVRETIAALISDGLVSGAVVAVSLKGAASQLELVQRLRSDLGQHGLVVQSSLLLSEGRAAMEDHMLMVAGFLGIMSQLMIIVGGLGLASTMSLAVLERTREIGVLRAIGARHHSILTMVLVEGLVIGLASWLIAIPASVPMSIVLGEAFGRVMLPVPVIYFPEAAGVLKWLAVVLVVSVVASAFPAWRAMRVPARTALAYE